MVYLICTLFWDNITFFELPIQWIPYSGHHYFPNWMCSQKLECIWINKYLSSSSVGTFLHSLAVHFIVSIKLISWQVGRCSCQISCTIKMLCFTSWRWVLSIISALCCKPALPWDSTTLFCTPFTNTTSTPFILTRNFILCLIRFYIHSAVNLYNVQRMLQQN